MNQSRVLKILIANGVNLDLLGKRQPEIYGFQTLKDLEAGLDRQKDNIASAFGIKLDLSFFQSNDEAQYLKELSKDWDGAILNPGAWTHTSLALADRVAGLELKFVELHISNLCRRESVRKTSYTAQHALGVVYGFGLGSYATALFGLVNAISSNT